MTFFDCKAAVVEVYFAFALVHDSQGIEIVNFTISLALSASMLMASAGTPYRLVPAHFYPLQVPTETGNKLLNEINWKICQIKMQRIFYIKKS